MFLALPGDEVSALLTTERQYMKPGTTKLYVATSNVEAAYEELAAKGVDLAGSIRQDTWATWFDVRDLEGNHVLVTGRRGRPRAGARAMMLRQPPARMYDLTARSATSSLSDTWGDHADAVHR